MADNAADIIIIGAGMAGLAAARVLREGGREAVILDKGRGVGGRMATRRSGGAAFDHGAQFVTTREVAFGAWLEEARRHSAAAVWCHGFGDAQDGHPRWRGVPGMTGLARYLAAEADIRLTVPVTALRKQGGGFLVETEQSGSWTANAVVLTPPVPQSLALLERGACGLPAAIRGRLESVRYQRCLAVMAELESPSKIPPPGALSFETGPVAWMADNQQKGVSPVPAVTLHASAEFSLENWERDRQQVAGELLAAVTEQLGARVGAVQIHGWRYSRPVEALPERCLAAVPDLPGLVFAGDAFGGPRVEGAALSGMAAARHLLAL
jgi:renalase